jgi:hypothetical protein
VGSNLTSGLPRRWVRVWKVRHVVDHMTMAFRISSIRFFRGSIRARFSYDWYADRAARADVGRRPSGQSAMDNIEHRWQPPGSGPAGALSHNVIHGLDIAVNLSGGYPSGYQWTLRKPIRTPLTR